ncbi:peptidoglycan-binding protein [Eubacteriales bacterium OttesenSCG-928-A19]|nr:peptidoglycan-binding protein [Eubacteriales bacterium OttesenSCG-928-A19]
MRRWIGWLLVCLMIALPATAQEQPLLSRGSAGAPVWNLQEALAAQGYLEGEPTGIFEDQTEAAVRAYQEANGLASTGVADADLQRRIVGVAWTLPEGLAFEGKLTYGDEGERVRYIQARLAELGFYTIEVSGNFLGNTRNAVKAFQSQNGLSADGIVGEQTWIALFEMDDPVSADATPRPSPSPSPVPYRIGVDLTNQVTTVYARDDAGTYSSVVKHMLCSTGTESDPTPPGTYILNGDTSRWCYFPKWGTHAQYWTRIDAYNAFHSVIYGSANEKALKKSSYTGLGAPASHGCIRLMVEDAKWLYDNIGKGTEVVIYEGSPDEELKMALKLPPLDEARMLPEPTPQPTETPAYHAANPPALPDETMTRGSEGEAVYWMQCRLAELGFFRGTTTGGYYDGTINAVKAFQQASGLPVTGDADIETLLAMQVDTRFTPAPEVAYQPESILAISGEPALNFVPPTDAGTSAPTAMPTGVPSFYVPREQRVQP